MQIDVKRMGILKREDKLEHKQTRKRLKRTRKQFISDRERVGTVLSFFRIRLDTEV